jgi:hypothetical protein
MITVVQETRRSWDVFTTVHNHAPNVLIHFVHLWATSNSGTAKRYDKMWGVLKQFVDIFEFSSKSDKITETLPEDLFFVSSCNSIIMYLSETCFLRGIWVIFYVKFMFSVSLTVLNVVRQKGRVPMFSKFHIQWSKMMLRMHTMITEPLTGFFLNICEDCRNILLSIMMKRSFRQSECIDIHTHKYIFNNRINDRVGEVVYSHAQYFCLHEN